MHASAPAYVGALWVVKHQLYLKLKMLKQQTWVYQLWRVDARLGFGVISLAIDR